MAESTVCDDARQVLASFSRESYCSSRGEYLLVREGKDGPVLLGE
jgi:hypothetical protein